MENTSGARYNAKEAQNKFRTRLRALVADPETNVADPEKKKNLASALGVTTTTIDLYLSDTENAIYPKTANLIKIADYFHKSLDFIVGISDVETPDATIRGCCEYTGLRETAIKNIRKCNSEMLSRLLENDNFVALIDDAVSFEQDVDTVMRVEKETASVVPVGRVEDNQFARINEKDFPNLVSSDMPEYDVFTWRNRVDNLKNLYNVARLDKHDLLDAASNLIEEVVPSRTILEAAKKTLKERGERFGRSAEMNGDE